jgi:uncharacterized protein (TIGR02145 family)/uncharacterized repeat protein (TIGR02543 family)
MKLLNQYGLTLLLAALLSFGCSKKLTVSETSGASSEMCDDCGDTLSKTSDISSVTYGTLADARDGRKYRTVEIGGQTWMAENLKYAPKGGNSRCYKDDKDTCDKYGRLYDWETARTVCPVGWRLPSAQDWDELTGWVHLASGVYAAKALIAASGWERERRNLIGAENDYGFSALPGGLYSTEYEFMNIGYNAVWWTDTERDGNYANYRRIATDKDGVIADISHKKSGHSVRCVMDYQGPAALAPIPLTLKAAVGGTVSVYPRRDRYKIGKRFTIIATPKSGYVFDKWTGGRVADAGSAVTAVVMDSNMTVTANFRPVAYGMLSDKRDGRTYKTVKMPDGMVWMAENLNYAPSSGKVWVYRSNTVYSDKYGKLYDWETAKTACPDGWRLPTRQEWNRLGEAAGGKPREDRDGNINWRGAGRKLKATSGWGENDRKHNEKTRGSWNGSDDYGFSALSGGYFCGPNCSGGGFYGAGDDDVLDYEYGNWWTATVAAATTYGVEQAYYRRISFDSADLEEDDVPRNNGYSVRCVTGADGFVASTAPAAYSLTVRAADGGSVSVDPVKTVYTAGEKVSISATPNCGFVFSKWTDGETADASATATTVTVNSNMTVTAIFTRVTPYVAHGAFTDKRDGKTYKTVQMCKQVWMAENLNYKTDSSKCYDNKDSNCGKYGRLYDWETASKACPSGWHLASNEEWEELEGHADGWKNGETTRRGSGGNILKTMNGWKKYGNSREDGGGNGTDDLKFSAPPGGVYAPKEGFFQISEAGNWWTSTELRDDEEGCCRRRIVTKARENEGNGAVVRQITYISSSVRAESSDKSYGFSVRCVNDKDGDVPPPAALTLKLLATTGGTVSVDPSKASYIAGERVMITAVPNRGYTFAKWTGGKVADTGSAVTVVTVSSNMAITANFSKSKAPPPVYGSLTDARDGKKYETVSIGGKAWMAQNLNYETPDSSWCYGDSVVNCVKYGRLYTWNVARTACPTGWHLPTEQEFEGLIKATGGENAAGKKLKTVFGWTLLSFGWARTGNGTDDYGFSALPGGRHYDRGFDDINIYGYWWTATEYGRDPNEALYLKMEESNVKAGLRGDPKDNGFSVRCVIDEPAPYKLTLIAGTGGSVSANPVKTSYKVGEQVSITAVPNKGYIFAKWSGGKVSDTAHAVATVKMDSNMTLTANFNKNDAPQIVYGALTDKRDGTKYKTTVIGGKTWMAENLNYQTREGSWCYDRKTDNCAKYGRLYNWGTAQKACPAGWHLPTRDEWKELVAAAGGDKAADKTLKSTSGWNRGGNGTDYYGFSALPGGFHDDHDIKYEYIGNDGYWWTATEEERKSDIGAYILIMTSDSGKTLEDTYYKRDGASVRCVMDEDGKLTLIAGAGGSAKASNKVNGQVTITAVPDSGYAFNRWSGGLVANVSAETTTVVVNANMTITANFTNLFSGTLSDKRDGKTYKTVKIGRNRWMAENLNYKASGSWCYENNDSYCAKYGRLYDWNAANKACPAGWHLPSRAEWDTLAETAGGWYYIQRSNREDGITWYETGMRLKSKTGWNQDEYNVNTNNVGFSALPGGYRGIIAEDYDEDEEDTPKDKGKREKFDDAGTDGYWWSSATKGKNRAFSREMDNITTDVFKEDNVDKSFGYSVRCVSDK